MIDAVLFGTDDLYLLGGSALVLLVIAQLAVWVGGGLNRCFADKKKLRLNLQILEQQLAAARVEREIAEGEVGWQGWRSFRVSKLVREQDAITSVYLTPEDRRPLPFYRPGQYLTFQFPFPDEKKPLVRCYSLSDAPNSEFYRCTIKQVKRTAESGEAIAGKVSSYIHRQLREGDLIKAKAPSGHFHLDLNDNQPVVLLAGGIGITPLYSMLASIVQFQPHRRVILFYGGKNSGDYALRSEIAGLASRHRNIHLINCFSEPLETDRLGVDFDVHGWVTPELLKSTLPANNFQFYLCGPGPFMTGLFAGLQDWGVPTAHIHFEAFGPSSITRPKTSLPPEASCDRPVCKIRFARSAVEVDFDDQLESILEAAEQVGIDIDSGCRAGNCGTCEIAILKGKAKYLKEAGVQPPEGHALSCVTTPDGDLEIDA